MAKATERRRTPAEYRFRLRLLRNVHADIIADIERLTAAERLARVQFLLSFAITQLAQIRNGNTFSAVFRVGQTGRMPVAANESDPPPVAGVQADEKPLCEAADFAEWSGVGQG